MIPDDASPPAAAAHAQPPLPPRRLLLVEDNAANEKVAVAMLATMGFQTDVAANGAEAVDAFARGDYMAILMDCQMPVMDGYAATAGIRVLEEGGTSRTPVIAMTASAMGGAKEKCLAAGMDDYVSKPIMLNELRATLLRWVVTGTEPAARDTPGTGSAQRSDDPFDAERVASLRALDAAGRLDMFMRLATIFVDEAASQVAALGQALSDGDCQRAQRDAHALRGGAATVGAVHLADLCAALEERLLAGDAPGADALAPTRAEYDRVRSSLDSRADHNPTDSQPPSAY